MSASSFTEIEGLSKMQYTFHQKRVKIPVNKENAIKSGIADTNMVKLPLENELKWSIKGTMIKSDLMVLDLLAHYDWTRPIYFAGNASAHSGLSKYFQMEGLTYKLTPYAISGQHPVGTDAHTFHEDKMYNNLMDNFAWGNMNKQGVLVDYYTMRMVYNLRGQFMRFSEELIRNAKTAEERGDFELAKERRKKAEEILDRCFEVMPFNNVAPDDLCYYMVGNYFDLKHADPKNEEVAAKAEDLAMTLIGMRMDDLNYFHTLDDEWTGKQIREIGKALLHIEVIRQASLTQQETSEQMMKNEVNPGILKETEFEVLKTKMQSQFMELIKNTADREVKAQYKKEIMSQRIFPRIIAEEWFPALFEQP
jgi:hypothetical protein